MNHLPDPAAKHGTRLVGDVALEPIRVTDALLVAADVSPWQ